MDELTELALEAARGDRSALEQFVRRSQADVYRFCVHLVGVREAEELTQDTYLRAIPALARFRGDSSARTWILSIARKASVDHIRRQVRERRLVEKVASTTGETAGPPVHGSTAEIADLLDRLDLDRREAFVLTQMLGFRYAEAAEIIGCPIGTVRSRVARAREDLVTIVRADELAAPSAWADAPWTDPTDTGSEASAPGPEPIAGNQRAGSDDY